MKFLFWALHIHTNKQVWQIISVGFWPYLSFRETHANNTETEAISSSQNFLLISRFKVSSNTEYYWNILHLKDIQYFQILQN
jgi:hypothetical protein